MSRATYPLKLPRSIKEAAARLAREDGVSLNQWIAAAVILVLFWAAFALYPAPPADFDWESVGVSNDWPHLQTGFAAHWNKNENLSAASFAMI